MAKLIILRGNSGSGKTTVAKVLQAKLGPNTMLISHDMVRIQILNTSSRMGVEKSLPLMMELMKYGRKHSDVTIIEGILPVKDYKDLFDAAVQEFGDNICACYYDLPFEETVLRHSTKPNRGDFGEEDMRRWWLEKDFLPQIKEKILTKEMDLEAAVSLILSDINQGE